MFATELLEQRMQESLACAAYRVTLRSWRRGWTIIVDSTNFVANASGYVNMMEPLPQPILTDALWNQYRSFICQIADNAPTLYTFIEADQIELQFEDIIVTCKAEGIYLPEVHPQARSIEKATDLLERKILPFMRNLERV